VSEELLEYQRKQRQRVVDAINAAQREIEAEIAEHGYYPKPGKRLTAREVCRRAGVGTSTLKNKTHEVTRSNLRTWLHRMKLETGDRSEPAVPKSSASTEQYIIELARKFDRFKLQYEMLEARCLALEEENAKLRAMISQNESGSVTLLQFKDPKKRGF
jgi:AraC-like DNA-binding protein